MSRRTVFVPYQPKNVLNKHKRADTWFWTRYSAYPYMGCQHGCEFCYCREEKYYPFEDVNDFAYQIKVKENAPALLRKALQRAPVDGIFTGDYQPAERKFRLSRQMLEVCLELGFPVFVLERSALVTCDLPLLQAIQQRAWAVVAFSIIAAPNSPGYARVRQLEPLASPPEKRFQAMQQFAQAGILTGTAMMPILPGICDDDANLEAVVRSTAEHGGKFVIASGLTLADRQSAITLWACWPSASPTCCPPTRSSTLPAPSYGPTDWPWPKIALRLRQLCRQYGISDRIPRPLIPGEKRILNKRIVEVLADRLYEMELRHEPSYRLWDFRKAAWAIEDMEQEIGLLYRTLGRKGLESRARDRPAHGPLVESLINTLP